MLKIVVATLERAVIDKTLTHLESSARASNSFAATNSVLSMAPKGRRQVFDRSPESHHRVNLGHAGGNLTASCRNLPLGFSASAAEWEVMMITPRNCSSLDKR